MRPQLELLWELTKRDLKDRNRGQALGRVWLFGYPIMIMLFFGFLFTLVFPNRSDGTNPDAVISILAGLLAWFPLADVMGKSTTLLQTNSGLVKQIVFPIQVLPAKTALSLFLGYSGAFIFVFVLAAFRGTLSLWTLTLPILIAISLLTMIGLSLILSFIGIALRDTREIVAIFLTVNLFCMPIFYSIDNLPQPLQWIVGLNPFSYIVLSWQQAFTANAPNPSWAILVAVLFSVFLYVIGMKIYSRASETIGELL